MVHLSELGLVARLGRAWPSHRPWWSTSAGCAAALPGALMQVIARRSAAEQPGYSVQPSPTPGNECYGKGSSGMSPCLNVGLRGATDTGAWGEPAGRTATMASQCRVPGTVRAAHDSTGSPR